MSIARISNKFFPSYVFPIVGGLIVLVVFKVFQNKIFISGDVKKFFYFSSILSKPFSFITRLFYKLFPHWKYPQKTGSEKKLLELFYIGSEKRLLKGGRELFSPPRKKTKSLEGSKARLGDLPLELQDKIVCFLDWDWKDVICLSQTSKKWKRWGDEVMQEIRNEAEHYYKTYTRTLDGVITGGAGSGIKVTIAGKELLFAAGPRSRDLQRGGKLLELFFNSFPKLPFKYYHYNVVVILDTDDSLIENGLKNVRLVRTDKSISPHFTSGFSCLGRRDEYSRIRGKEKKYRIRSLVCDRFCKGCCPS